VLYSFVVCVISLKILKLLNVKDWAYVAVAAFVIFYPRGIQFSGALNNDGVAYMLSVMALYFVLKWWRKGKRLCDIIGCALGIGAGMMAKMSSATVCLPVAGIFIYEFVRTLKKREDALTLKKMIVQYAVFLVICAPLGLWFQVYAKIRFDQPFGYVFDKLNQRLSTAGHTAFERFFPIAFDSHEYFDSVWCHVFGWNYNLFHFALRSSIYGEFNEYTRGESVAIAAVTFAYIAVVLLIVVLVRATYLFFRYDLKRKDDKSKIEKENVFFVLLLMLSQILSMIYFNIKMPYACTMDFRYIMPMILGMGLTLWLSCGRLCRSGGRLSIALVRCTVAVCIAFLATSALFYITFI
jgi:4-amino-4-deoxy-L-arabinose transferase-like glycosyltransferase